MKKCARIRTVHTFTGRVLALAVVFFLTVVLVPNVTPAPTALASLIDPFRDAT